MELPRNSVWESAGCEALLAGAYRILDVLLNAETVILFTLDNNSSTVRPLAISIDNFIELVKANKLKPSRFQLPDYLLIAEDAVSEEHAVRRDKNYQLVSGLISDKLFLFDYSTKKRVPQLSEYANKVDVDRKTIARLLTRYWRYGQTKMALLPAFAHSGGLGVDRIPSDKPLGAPKRTRTLALGRAEKFIVSDIDKCNFMKALKKYYLKESGISLVKTYKNLLKDSYEYEIRLAEANARAPILPSKKQFSYWSKKWLTEDEIVRRRSSEGDYLRNKRQTLKGVTQDSFLPGTYFEIDATVADIHIVSELGSQFVLGRPTIYIVVDRASRMIVGMHVSLYHASWRAARQALTNSFLPKSDYCKEFGIDIDDSEWPCAHIPKELVCDNGEMIGIKPNEALSPMTQLSFTPPYRPDCKGVVEQRFNILNNEVLHNLLGTTKGGQVVRGHRDPRKDAIYTLKEVTIEIIKTVLAHNRTILSNLAFSSPLLINHDLPPTPLNYWKIHITKHRHDLRTANHDEIIARLLPPSEASMTRSGIFYNGLYYSCPEVEERNLASIARTSGQWRLEVRVDENTTNYIYVRLDKNKGFTRCELLPRSRMFANKFMVEADFVQDWLDSKKETSPTSVASIEDHKAQNRLTIEAKKRSKNSNKLTFIERTRNVRQRRRDELYATTNIISEEYSSPLSSSPPEPVQNVNTVVVLPKGRERKSVKGKNHDY
ncbi:transposase [Vibrio cholerae]|uniref:transposase n=1 Tax=Vibrio cholerae TaxID=666 RepID=UPI00307FEE6B